MPGTHSPIRDIEHLTVIGDNSPPNGNPYIFVGVLYTSNDEWRKIVRLYFRRLPENTWLPLIGGGLSLGLLYTRFLTSIHVCTTTKEDVPDLGGSGDDGDTREICIWRSKKSILDLCHRRDSTPFNRG